MVIEFEMVMHNILILHNIIYISNMFCCFRAKYMIMAMAPPLQLRITFEPPMPMSRNQLVQRMPMGSVIKTMTYYDKPYWKEKGRWSNMYDNQCHILCITI